MSQVFLPLTTKDEYRSMLERAFDCARKNMPKDKFIEFIISVVFSEDFPNEINSEWLKKEKDDLAKISDHTELIIRRYRLY